MDWSFPNVRNTARGYIAPVAVATVTAVGVGTGAYLGTHSAPTQTPDKHQFELWSPSVNPNTADLVIFKYDKITGQTWALLMAKDAKGKATGQVAWALVTDPSAVVSPTATP
jgi:hypothetical protein